MDQVLPCLIRLLQFGDSAGRSTYSKLDKQVYDIFPTGIADRIGDGLTSQGKQAHFFSRWQLLLAIKLICAFGSRDSGEVDVTADQFLELLLKINNFDPELSDVATIDSAVEGLKSVALKSYSLPRPENLGRLIGRYSELFGRLAAPSKRGTEKNWVDIQKVVAERLGVPLDTFKAVLFALYTYTIDGSSEPDDGWVLPQLGDLDPEELFVNTQVPEQEVAGVLELVSKSPKQIRQMHRSRYGDSIGEPNDLGVLVRNPVVILPEGHLAAISPQLLIHRYTNGLYWDIFDALPKDENAKPNRERFAEFFGELHERYGCDILQRIRSDKLEKKKRKSRLLLEKDYRSDKGKNPDALLIEYKGDSNTRCTMFEFKVGRPKYTDSIVAGNVQAFEEDLNKKVGAGLGQEIGFYQQVQSGERDISGLTASKISAWFFVIVVTDPFPSMDMFLKPLREKLAAEPAIGKAKRYGPFVLSLNELEQLEMLNEDQVSEWFIRFENDRVESDWTFNNFYMRRTGGREVTNSFVQRLAEDDIRTGWARVT